jgi:cell division protease FtsH
MQELNVYRGKLLAYTFSEYGRVSLSFVRLPTVTRVDIVLPDADLDAIERHTVGVSERADALLATHQHLKRGLLLYGPPGTGKTYSVMYLCNQMPGRTTVMLSGPATSALGRAVAIARTLQPSMVVLEDVDLVAMERTLPGMGTNPLLFQLLNEMDGLAPDADIVFVLTTNRVELLEPALASRPGRIDQAVEITLPDANSRRRLFELYLRHVPTDVVDLDALATQAEGSSPAFIKELVRRAVLDAARPGAAPEVVNDQHLWHALTDLLEHSAPLTRSILGAAPSTAPGARGSS